MQIEYAWWLRALAGRIWCVMNAVMPRWLVATFAVCLVIPGPFDEMAVALVGVVFILVRRERARAAWQSFVN